MKKNFLRLCFLCLVGMTLFACKKEESFPKPMETSQALTSSSQVFSQGERRDYKADLSNKGESQALDKGGYLEHKIEKNQVSLSKDMTDLYLRKCYILQVDQVDFRIRDIEAIEKGTSSLEDRVKLKVDQIQGFELGGFYGDKMFFELKEDGFVNSITEDGPNSPKEADGTKSIFDTSLTAAIYKNVSHKDFEEDALIWVPIVDFHIDKGSI